MQWKQSLHRTNIRDYLPKNNMKEAKTTILQLILSDYRCSNVSWDSCKMMEL